MSLVLLAAAAIAYAVGGLFMKMAGGLSRPVPVAAFLSLFAGGALLQALGMRQSDLGVAYVVVLGLEAVAALALSVVVLHERLTPARIVAIALVLIGVAVLRRA